MYRRTALTAAVSLVAVSAGCTGSEDEQPSDSEPEDADDNQTDDAESVNETEEELTLETFEYPEAVDQDGFRRNLASVHADRLEEAGSFQLTRETETTRQHGSDDEKTVTTVNGDTIFHTHDEDGYLTTEKWSDLATGGGDVLVRSSNGFDERYRTEDQSRLDADIDGSVTLGALLDAAMFEASELDERDGTPVVVFESVDVINASALESVQRMERYDDLEASIVVSEGGVVSYQWKLEGERFDRPRMIRESGTVEDVGEATLEEPDWVDEARERALELSIEPAADESSFVVTVERGDPIPSGAQIDFFAGTQLRGELDREITQEDTLYLYNDGGQLGTSVNSEPNSGSALQTDFADLHIRTESGLVVYEGGYDAYAEE